MSLKGALRNLLEVPTPAQARGSSEIDADQAAIAQAISLGLGAPQIQYANRASIITAAGQIQDGVITAAKLAGNVGRTVRRGDVAADGAAESAGNVAAGGTRYLQAEGKGLPTTNTTESVANRTTIAARTIYGIYLILTTNVGTTNSVLTLRKNNADTALVLTITPAQTGILAATSAAGISFAAGDVFCLKYVQAAIGAATITGWGFLEGM